MGRKKMPISLLTRNNPRWRAFGEWLRMMREGRLEIEAAAEAVGVSERQWHRYESGATSFPRGRIPALSKLFKVSEGRILMIARYEDSDGEIDPEIELRQMWDHLLEGNLAAASQQLFGLHYLLRMGKRHRLGLPSEEHVQNNYMNALLAIYELPGWLCADLIKHIQKNQELTKDTDFPLTPKRRAKLLKSIQLPWANKMLDIKVPTDTDEDP